MILIPHKDSNNFILYLIIQLLKFKTIESYTELINETFKNVIGFEKDICFISKRDIREYRKKIKKVIIPHGTYVISDMAFNNCELLEEIFIPKTVYYLTQHTFYGCVNLKRATIAKNQIQEHIMYKSPSLEKEIYLYLPIVKDAFESNVSITYY